MNSTLSNQPNPMNFKNRVRMETPVFNKISLLNAYKAMFKSMVETGAFYNIHGSDGRFLKKNVSVFEHKFVNFFNKA